MFGLLPRGFPKTKNAVERLGALLDLEIDHTQEIDVVAATVIDRLQEHLKAQDRRIRALERTLP